MRPTLIFMIVLTQLAFNIRGQTTGHGPPQIVSNQTLGAEDVISADLNGDGASDILSASRNDSSIAWHANLGGGAFGPRQIITAQAVSARSVVAADLTGDGDLDVLYTAGTTVAWSENLGNGIFGPPLLITSQADFAASAAAADLDGDGDMDILSASSDDQKIAWYENLGNGVFGSQLLITNQLVGARSVEAADLDGDGAPDVIAAASFSVVWFQNTGAGTFGAQQVITGQVSGTLDIHASDIDGDGDVDVLSASANDDKIAWYQNLGGGVFGPQIVITNQADFAQSVAVADVDDDGDLDVLSASKDDDTVAWYENVGAETFGPRQVITNQAIGARSVFADDLDGDGDYDALFVFGDTLAWSPSLFSLRENPLVAATLSFPNQELGASLAPVGDLDNDGHPDLVVGGPAWNDNRGIIRAWSPNANQVLWTVCGTQIGGRLGSSLATAGDLDNDGVQDVIVGAPGAQSGRGQVFALSGGTGTLIFCFQGLVAGDALGTTVASAGDWNGDGVNDIAAGAPRHDFIGNDSGYVCVYSGANGNVLHTSFGLAAGERFGQGLAFVPDRNADGFDELVVSRRSGGTAQGALLVLAGDSGATLSTLSSSNAGPEFGVALDARTDLDGDGISEILVGDPSANGGNGEVTLFDGASLSPIRSHPGSAGAQLGAAVSFAGNLNGDGHEDYLLGAPRSGDSQGAVEGGILIIDGTSGFDLNGSLVTQGIDPGYFQGGLFSEFGSSVVSVGDLDGDGFDEFAVGITARSRVWVFGGLNPDGFYHSCAAGTADEPLLFINGSSGGAARLVASPINTPITLSVVQPTTSLVPSSFAIAGFLGVPLPNQVTVLPFNLGTLCLPPLGVNPGTFILTNNFAPFVPQVLPSTPTPWSVTDTGGLAFPFQTTIQGVITVTPGDLRITNAIVLEITP